MPDFAVWLSQREETAGWLSHVSLLLSSAMQILECMQGGTTVIIHCRFVRSFRSLAACYWVLPWAH